MIRATGSRLIARPPMAHLPEPEPRWRWVSGMVGEILVLLFAVAVILAAAGLQS